MSSYTPGAHPKTAANRCFWRVWLYIVRNKAFHDSPCYELIVDIRMTYITITNTRTSKKQEASN